MSGRRRFLAGAIFIALLTLASIWVADLLAAQQARERCLASGRRDCIDLNLPADQRSRPNTAPVR